MSSWAKGLQVASAIVLGLCAASCSLIAKSPSATVSPAPTASQRLVVSGGVVVDGALTDEAGLLNTENQAALAVGAAPLRIVATGAAAEGDRVGNYVTLRKDLCLLAIARGTQQIEDLDVLIFDDSGVNLSADQSIGPAPAVILCPPHPERLYLTARVASGRGLVVLGALGVRSEIAQAVALRLGAPSALPQGDVLSQAWPTLEAKVTARRKALGGRWEELRRVSVPVGSQMPSYLSTSLPGMRCLDVMVLPGEDLGPLDLTLSDERGRELQRVLGVTEERSGLVCSPVDTDITVRLRAHQGHGTVAVVLARSGPDQQNDLVARSETLRTGPMQTLDKVQKQQDEALQRAGYAKPIETHDGQLDSTQLLEVPLHLPQGCSRIDVMAGSPLVGLSAKLWDRENELLTRREGGEATPLFACLASAQTVSLELQGIGRPGPYAVAVRKERAKPAELTQQPVAAGRLLGQVNRADRIVDVSALGALHVVDLDESKRSSVAVTVGPSTCQDIVVASSNGPSGVYLKAVRAGEEKALQLSQGSHEAQIQLCADHKPLDARVWVGASVGKGRGLMAVFPSARP